MIQWKITNWDLYNFGLSENAVMVDAPVSGGVPGAEAGTLTFMVLILSDWLFYIFVTSIPYLLS